MEDYKLVEKLKNEANISYEEAKIALEQSNWDILDAFVYLEEKGKVQKPSVNIFYTNEYKENHKNSLLTNNKNQGNNYNNTKKDNTFEGIFVKVCKIIDICNNIFFEIKKENKIFLRIPVTVIIVLLIFAFWAVIPLYIVGLFFDFEFSISGNRVEINKINHVLKEISENIKKIKGKLKRGFKNG
ncbi:ubiquitin [Clostridium beijerinckii]|uniref:Ubiquitin n=1 Tax=Clostridium beijerinckii TaxID=1520 RepID=A0A1S8RYN5_CLOBE|nr:ubiquitin [Clostridium beijerinckii]NRT36225.1 hypothetical protein [Clostridium beijerinckii]NRT44348.1 hypothetical protein [Clostridium beijerinckii]NRT86356.1 hypothetical protein [Clostridium beijerinckii]NRY59265.1 hypothetical protein [Clostridium beijerinckii]NRZ21660.1 hypothetical protein [Clostridium beijerinckii]